MGLLILQSMTLGPWGSHEGPMILRISSLSIWSSPMRAPSCCRAPPVQVRSRRLLRMAGAWLEHGWRTMVHVVGFNMNNNGVVEVLPDFSLKSSVTWRVIIGVIEGLYLQSIYRWRYNSNLLCTCEIWSCCDRGTPLIRPLPRRWKRPEMARFNRRLVSCYTFWRARWKQE